jgi:two-component system, chemotaxis family, sensor kinase CheA
MIIEDPELMKEFVVESQEHLADVESQLLALEESQDDIDVALVNKVFRSVHSIKGAAGFLGLHTLETLAHRGEEVLDCLRNKEIRPTNQVVNTLLKAIDRLKHLLDSIESSNEQDVSENVLALESLLRGSDSEVGGTSTGPSVPPASLVATNSVSSPPVLEQQNEPSNGSLREAVKEFVIESGENLNAIERDVVLLERDPDNESIINNLFRSIHTIKGTAGFLAFNRMEELTHAGENLLGAIRNKQITFDHTLCTEILSIVDTLKHYLEMIELSGTDGERSCTAQVDHVNQLLSHYILEERSPVAATTDSNKPPQINQTVMALPDEKKGNGLEIEPTFTDAKKTNPNNSTKADSHSSASVDSTIRVDVALLDKLMTRVGELVLARNQIMQFTNLLGNSELLGTSQRLNLITTELQEGVMKTRMQQIGNVWSKFPRMVRDLAAICGKQVRIEMEGKETELDKTIIESIKDPLTHLVRNTVDHGIEKPSVRQANGKPLEGCLTLRAFHEGGQVNIEISDDGAGLNLERIKEKAIEKGLITSDQAMRLSEREISQLIFLPGFSTAETVSNVSGRGVGMDVVKTNIEKIGGTVDLQTVKGIGTTIKVKIPLTLAIIPALVVTNEGGRFAIPQVNLLELVRLEGEEATTSIEWIQGAPVYRLRGRLLPLVYLNGILNGDCLSRKQSEVTNIVVLRAEDRQFGLVVNGINDTEEIVVKPLSSQLKGVNVYSGATIMGDGKVALILDVLGIAKRANLISKDRTRAVQEDLSKHREGAAKKQNMLLLEMGTNRRLGIPISEVARLEKIPASKIEFAENKEVVQYRGEILPLIRLAHTLGVHSGLDDEEELLNVIVYRQNGKSYGLVVNRIVDIVETEIDLDKTSNQDDGTLGSAIIQGYVTDFANLPAIICRSISY